jgi:Tol biopolymer transport system component
MRKAAMASTLVGLMAAGAALTGAHAPSAAPDHVAGVTRDRCSPGKRAGEAVQVKYKLIVAGQTVARTALGRGMWVETDRGGVADICLKQGSWACKVRPATRVRALPPKERNVLLYLALGRLSCSTPAGGSKKLRTPRETLTLGNRLAGRRGAAAADASRRASVALEAGTVFSLAVTKRQTVIKVLRGAAVVAPADPKQDAVVVSRGEQSVAPAGQEPGAPTPIKLTPEEQAIFRELSRTLPKETDKTPPSARVTSGPNDPSPDKTPTFTFGATEERVIFSCALDGTEFRHCPSPQQFASLEPGRHTLLVVATDPAGNTGAIARYSWTIQRPGPIAFESNRDGNYEIYLTNPDGSGQLRLTNSPASIDVDPAWSPDGNRLAFESDRDKQGPSEIYVMNADGSNQTRLTVDPANDRNPKWSPLGQQIAFESNRDGTYEIYVMNADGTRPTRLTTDGALDSDPAWSPDGSRIAFVSDRDGNQEIYVMNADGRGQPTRLTANGARDSDPAWSPNGDEIAFVSDRDGNQEIYVMNADGTAQARLTAHAARDADPAWSPDGGRLVFVSDRDGNPELYLMTANGSAQTRVTNNAANDLVPSW